MATTQFDGTARLIRVIRSELRSHRTSAADLSRRLEQNHDYVGMRLRREVGITIDFLERLCGALGVSVWELLDRARPRDLVAEMAPRDFLELSIEKNAVLSEPFADIGVPPAFPAGRDRQMEFPADTIREFEDEVWTARQRAIERTAFWLSDIKEARGHADRRPVAYAAGMACLAGLVRSSHVADAHLLLVEALRLAEEAQPRSLTAYVTEKAARLAWDLGRQHLAIRWLEDPSLLAHPLQDSYFSIRGAYYFYRRRFEESLDCFGIVDELSKSELCKGSSLDFRALIAAEEEGLLPALKILDRSDDLDLPQPARNTLEWTRARVLQLHGREYEAHAAYERLLPQEGDPQRRGYMLIDYLSSSPPSAKVAAIDRLVGLTLEELNLQESTTNRSIFQQLSALRWEHSSADPASFLRRQLRPGG